MKILLIIFLIILGLIPILISIYLIICELIFKHYFSKKGKYFKNLKLNYNSKFSSEEIENYFSSFKEINIKINEEKLTGYLKINNNKNTNFALLVHSLGANHQQMYEVCVLLEKEGLNILAIDLLGGGSFDNEIAFGQEISCWISKIKELNLDAKILVYGAGVGGAQALVCGDNNKVNLIITDGCFDDAQRFFSFVMRKQPANIRKMIFAFAKRTKQLNLKSISPIERIKKIGCPVLIVHAKNQLVPVEMGFNLSQAQNQSKRHLLVTEDCFWESGEKMDLSKKNEIKKFIRNYF